MESQQQQHRVRTKVYLELDSGAAPIILVTYIDPAVSLSELAVQLGAQFGHVVESVLQYEDEEHDRVSLLQDQDLDEAFAMYRRMRLAAPPTAVVTLKVYCKSLGPAAPSQAAAAAAPRPRRRRLGASGAALSSTSLGSSASSTRTVSNAEDSVFQDSYWNKFEGDDSIVSLEPPPDFAAFAQPSQSAGVAKRHSMKKEPLHFTLTGKKLGSGQFGTVYQGILPSGQVVAVKEIKVPQDEGPRTLRQLLEVDKEIAVLRNLDHVHIIRFLGSVRRGDAIHICLEYADGGSLFDFIKTFGALSSSISRNYTQQMLLGLDYLHKQSIVHRDIKSANILLDQKGKVLKLSDFGCSKVFRGLKLQVSAFDNLYGTPNWMAPEVIKQTGEAGRASDIWSIAGVVLEMLSGRPPWAQTGIHEVAALMFHIVSSDGPPPYPETLPNLAEDFLSQCFRREPKERPSAGHLLEHPFIVAGDSSEVPFRPLLQQVTKQEKQKAKELVNQLVPQLLGPEVYRFVVLGDKGVGKTGLVIQFVHSHFVEFYSPKHEASYQKEFVVDGGQVNVTILDPGGDEEEYGPLQHQAGDGFILVYDVTSPASFAKLEAYVERVDRSLHSCIVVGNKLDRASRRQVAKETALAFAKERRFLYTETSALEGIGIEQLFSAMVRDIRGHAAEREAARRTANRLSDARDGGHANSNCHFDEENSPADKKKKKNCAIM